jgi:hypothetical protein
MRYKKDSIIAVGTRYGTSDSMHNIRRAILSGELPFRETVITESQRLDVLAGIEYGNSEYWWIIAAASNIGWGLQVPPGISLKIPKLKEALGFI